MSWVHVQFRSTPSKVWFWFFDVMHFSNSRSTQLQQNLQQLRNLPHLLTFFDLAQHFHAFSSSLFGSWYKSSFSVREVASCAFLCVGATDSSIGQSQQKPSSQSVFTGLVFLFCHDSFLIEEKWTSVNLNLSLSLEELIGYVALLQDIARKPGGQLWDSIVELCAERRFLEAYKQARRLQHFTTQYCWTWVSSCSPCKLWQVIAEPEETCLLRLMKHTGE